MQLFRMLVETRLVTFKFLILNL